MERSLVVLLLIVMGNALDDVRVIWESDKTLGNGEVMTMEAERDGVKELFDEIEKTIFNFTSTTRKMITTTKEDGLVFINELQKYDVYLIWKDSLADQNCPGIDFDMNELKTSFILEFTTLTSTVSEIVNEIEDIVQDIGTDVRQTSDAVDMMTTICSMSPANCTERAKNILAESISKNWRRLIGNFTKNPLKKGDSLDHIIKKRETSLDYVCLNGMKIPWFWVCDGVPDCKDRSDENNCEKACNREFEWQCKNEQCIWKFRYCNGKDDCGDGSDEENCSNTTQNPNAKNDEEFLCENGNAIDKKLLCDGSDDCGDASDEICTSIKNATVDKVSCKVNQFQCNSSGLCIDKTNVCNGKKDCADGSDEAECITADPLCTFQRGKFSCNDTKSCIDLIKVCDGTEDCSDGSDETCADASDCPSRCRNFGGICFIHPSRPLCLRHCPDGFANVDGLCNSTASLSTLNNDLHSGTVIDLLEQVTLVTTNMLREVRLLKFQARQSLYTLSKQLSLCKNRNKHDMNILFI